MGLLGVARANTAVGESPETFLFQLHRVPAERHNKPLAAWHSFGWCVHERWIMAWNQCFHAVPAELAELSADLSSSLVALQDGRLQT
jgi:hypothetical protein